MVRFIFICMAVTFLSFPLVAGYRGISSDHEVSVANIEPAAGFDSGLVDNGTGLTFEEIYALADVYSDASMAQDDIAFILNDIEPAAGNGLEEIKISEEFFSTGFNTHSYPAL